MECGYLALDAPEAQVEFVFGQILKGVVPQNVSGDVFRRIGINRDAGIVGELLLLVELPECHALRGDGRHNARRHYIVGLDSVQFDYILDNLVLTVVQHAFLFSDVCHGRYFLTGDAKVRIIVRYGAVQLVNYPYNGVEQVHQDVHHA